MGYLKDIVTENLDGICAKKFFRQKIKPDDAKLLLQKSLALPEILPGIIDKYRSKMTTYSYEYPDTTIEDFEKSINNKMSTHQLRFPAYFMNIEYIGRTLFSECAGILYLIDCYSDNKSVTASSDAIRRYAALSKNLVEWTTEKMTTFKGHPYELTSQTLYELLEDYLFPYEKYSNNNRTDLFIPRQLYDTLYKSDEMIENMMNIKTLNDHWDDDLNDIRYEYGPCGELFQYMLTNEEVVNSLPQELLGIYVKTVLLMSATSTIVLDYFEESYEFAKTYMMYLNDEIDLDHDEFGNISGSILPESLNNRLYCVDAEEDAVAKSEEADTVMSNSVMAKDAGIQANNITADNVTENYKAKYLKFQKTVNDIKIKNMKRKQKSNSKFFKQWYGRVPSMYRNYGGTAVVTENRMKGDPSQILLTSGVQYLETVTQQSEKVFSDIVTLCKKVTSAGDINAKLNAVKSYCQQYKIEGDDTDPKTIKMQIVNETCYRIARVILQENGVYGYTPEGIVENHKFPTCNHIVVSLFVENAQEKPEEQSVSSIFESPEGLTVFAHPEKLNILDSSFSKSTNAVMTSFNPNMIGLVHKNLNNNYKMFTNTLIKNAAAAKAQGDYDQEEDDVGRSKKIAKAINDGLVESVDISVDQKKRCIQCVGAMYEMSGRIQELARRCIAALRQEELRHTDTNYNSGTKSNSLDRSVKASNRRNDRNSSKTNTVTRAEIAAKRREKLANMQAYAYS